MKQRSPLAHLQRAVLHIRLEIVPWFYILAKEYEKQINYYNLRHLIKPGITGWAQVMFPYGENLEDAKKKLEYDFDALDKVDLPHFGSIVKLLSTSSSFFTFILSV